MELYSGFRSKIIFVNSVEMCCVYEWPLNCLRNSWTAPVVSLIIGDVYFSDIEYLEIEQVPAMTLENFVSNIGGAMGLWTGASIVTWIQFVYFCIRMGYLGSKKGSGGMASRKKNGRFHKNEFMVPIVIHDRSVASDKGRGWNSQDRLMIHLPKAYNYNSELKGPENMDPCESMILWMYQGTVMLWVITPVDYCKIW